jgi:hypothetical protein
VIAATVSVTAALLCGWLAGLTAHALTVTRWRDPGARAAWLAGAGTGAATALITSIAVCVLTLSAIWLLAVAGCLGAGGLTGWRASDALSLRTQAAWQQSQPPRRLARPGPLARARRRQRGFARRRRRPSRPETDDPRQDRAR